MIGSRVALLVALLLVVAACYREQYLSTGTASFSNGAHMFTQLNRDGSPICHILFVPQWTMLPDHQISHAASGNVDQYEFRFAYRSAATTVRSEPLVLIKRKRLEASGRSYDLGDGNVFVAAVRLDGTVRVTQVPGHTALKDPKAVLALVKRSLAGDARVQALTHR